MSTPPLTVLLLDADPATLALMQGSDFSLTVAAGLQGASRHDAVLCCVDSPAALADWARRRELPQLAFDSALVVLSPAADETLESELIAQGVEAIVLWAQRDDLPRALHHAVLRKRLERAARTAYATDLATGLPHQAQLLEHMTQLLALREREPAPMVLLVLRIDGLPGAARQLGGESANVLRRKVAVRLRTGLRSSDVVAAIGPDAFGVLLGRLESRHDGERVAAKLVRSLQQPFMVSGQSCSVTASVGLALYPDHGKDAHSLLQRASAQAGSVAAMGAEGYAARVERSGGAAANDPAP